YKREVKRPAYLNEVQDFKIQSLEHPKDHNKILKTLLSSPDIASKKWVYDQFDVGSDTINRPGVSNSGVIRMEGTNKGLAMKTDCNGRYVYLNPRRGGQIAVAEAARNVVCSGAKPL